MIAQELDVSLPISIREQVLSAALSLMAQQKRERENTVTITKIENGFQVECHISGGEMDLMSFTLYVPDMMQAKLVKRNFQKDPQLIYSCMLAALTRNQDMVRELLGELS